MLPPAITPAHLHLDLLSLFLHRHARSSRWHLVISSQRPPSKACCAQTQINTAQLLWIPTTPHYCAASLLYAALASNNFDCIIVCDPSAQGLLHSPPVHALAQQAQCTLYHLPSRGT